MDGAVADGKGEAFPLICTTGNDVIGNLTRSLASYVKNGGTRKVAILATSQELTAKRRQNLEVRAQQKGFTLQQVYTRAAIADRLYRNTAWCRELLSLNGTPPALSVIPPTTRPLINIPMIGRADDLKWLSSQSGDRLLVGQPGSGKTFLLHEFANKGGGLFVVSRDRTEIAAEIRSQYPQSLIIDDAHVDLALLKDLQQLRRELDLSFDLIACSWTGEQAEVSHALSLPVSHVRTLDLLPRNQILAVIKSVGIFGPDELLRELVDQAEGRPGLAVTLAHLCLQGSVQEVALGDALNRSISASFGPLVGQHATELLAGFSIGGASGMRMDVVAQLFGLSLLQVRRDIARLAAGGVVMQLPEDHLTVRPEGLRHTLVRDLFFQKSLSITIQPFIDVAPDLADVVRTLIGTRSRGGDVPDKLLVPLLEKLGSSVLWCDFSSLGPAETAYVLRYSKAKINSIAGPALHFLPEEALTQLFNAALQEEITPSSRSLSLIRDWVRSTQPGRGDAVPRRLCVIGSVRTWLARNGFDLGAISATSDKHLPVAVQAISFALSPCFEQTSMDPGLGNTLTIARGVLTLVETTKMRAVWEEALIILRQIPLHLWKPVIHALEDWAYPARHGFTETHPDLQSDMQQLARHIVKDLAPLTHEHPGMAVLLNRVSRPLGFRPAVSIDPDFTVLFPIRETRDWQKDEQEQVASIQVLASQWASRKAADVASHLVFFESEADMASLTWPRLTQNLCYDLSERVPAPGDWAQAFLDAHLSPNFTRPFLVQAVNQQMQGWESLLAVFLNDHVQCGAAFLCVLMLPEPPTNLLDAALLMAGSFTQQVDTACLRNEVPIATQLKLLQHEDMAVREAAATGLWNANPTGVIQEELREEWRSAILCARHDEYWLGEILKADKSLTLDWLKARLVDEDVSYFRLSDSFQSAVTSLDEADRISLLSLIPDCWGVGELLGWLVGDNPSVYAALLQTPHLHSYQLCPLENFTEIRASIMTLQALDAGYDVASVAGAFLPSHWSWTGSEAEMWHQWIERMDILSQQTPENSKDPRLLLVAQSARSMFERYRDRAQVQEKAEAIYGRR